MFKKSFGKIAALAVVFSCLVTGAFAMAKSPSQAEVSAPQRIISLAPSGTEVLYAVGAGDRVVAVDEYSNYPLQAIELPKIGGFDGKTISIEKILSFEPDFIYLSKGMHDFLIPTLQEYGIDYYLSEGTSVEGVMKEIVEIGAICGNDKDVSNTLKSIENAILLAKNALAEKDDIPTVYYEVWTPPYMSIGGNTFISDVIAKAGGLNIFADLSDYPTVSEEAIIASNPSVILLQKTSGTTVESVVARKGWEEIDAVKNNKVFVIDDDVFSRPGPRIGEAITELVELLK